jgi:hypothetical protein
MRRTTALLPLVLVVAAGCGGSDDNTSSTAPATSQLTPGVAGKHVADTLKSSPRTFSSAEDIAENAVKPEDLAQLCAAKASLGYEATFRFFAGFGVYRASDGSYIAPRQMFDAILARC